MTTTLQGTPNNDTLNGTADSDLMLGGAGDDELIDLNRAPDTLRGGDGDDFLMANDKSQLFGERGNDQLVAGGSDMLLDGGAGNDWISSGRGRNTLIGGEGNDSLSAGSSGHNILVGGQGNDRLSTSANGLGSGDNLILVGLGSGHDTLRRQIDANPAVIGANDIVELAADIPVASVQATLIGRDLKLSWNAGADSITLQDYVGADMSSIAGYTVRSAGGQVLDFRSLVDSAHATLAPSGDLMVGHQTLGDTLQAGEGADTLMGRGGNDRLEGQLGQDLISGDGGDDTLLGGWDNDTVNGGTGNDLLQGNQGDDSLMGDDGDDTLQGGAGGDFLQGGAGRNQLEGNAGNDTLVGEIGSSNTYIAGSGLDTMSFDPNQDNTFVVGRNNGFDMANSLGNALTRDGTQTVRMVDGIRPDQITVGINSGQVRIDLLDGSSTLFMSPGAGHLSRIVFDDGSSWDPQVLAARNPGLPTSGPDQLFTTRTDVPLQGAQGNDTLSGQGAVTLDGGAGNDLISINNVFGTIAPGATLIGGSGDDLLQGDSGADTLRGGVGDDQLLGGNGLDTYVFNRGDGHDSIQEFGWCFSATPQPLQEAVAVRMGPGISADQLGFVRQGNELVIKLAGTDDQLSIQNYFFGQVTGSFITLADGSTISPELIDQKLVIDNSPLPVTPVTTSGNDTIDLSKGPTWGNVAGGTGSDTYLWSGRTNQIGIVDQSDTGGTGTDVLQLGAGITPDQVHLNYNFGGASSQGWVLTADERAGSVMAQGRMANTPISDLPLIRFADGQTWDQATISAKLLASAPDSMRTWAQGGNDTLRAHDAATGRALGGAGSDTYIVGLNNQISRIGSASDQPWWASEGVNQLFPNVPAPSASDVDTLRFTDGIRPQDLRAVQLDDGTGNLVLMVRGTDVRLDINHFLQDTNNASSEVDRVVFDDGTVWGRSDLSLLATRLHADGMSLQGGAGNNRITGEDGHDWLGGSNGRDTLDGGAGRDTLVGGAGNDSYYVDQADDWVDELEGQGKDVVYASVSYNLPDNAETLVLTGAADLTGKGRAQKGSGLVGNSGNNLLTGGTGSDTLAGGAGLDTLIGGAGGDFYRITEEQTQVIEQASDDGIDAISSFTEHLTMADHVEYLFLATDSAYAADGNAQENWMFGRASGSWLDGHAGDDHLTGGSGEDMLIGGAGDDELSGAAGNDHYTHASGDGFDVITDVDSRAGNVDTLDWQGVSAQQLWFSHVGNDLQIQVLGSTEGVRVANWFQGSANQIEHLTVGSQTLGNDRVAALVQVMASMSPPASSISSLGSADQARLQTALSAAWQG